MLVYVCMCYILQHRQHCEEISFKLIDIILHCWKQYVFHIRVCTAHSVKFIHGYCVNNYRHCGLIVVLSMSCSEDAILKFFRLSSVSYILLLPLLQCSQRFNWYWVVNMGLLFMNELLADSSTNGVGAIWLLASSCLNVYQLYVLQIFCS